MIGDNVEMSLDEDRTMYVQSAGEGCNIKNTENMSAATKQRRELAAWKKYDTNMASKKRTHASLFETTEAIKTLSVLDASSKQQQGNRAWVSLNYRQKEWGFSPFHSFSC